jgi:TatD DNase family protein
MLVDSHCHLDFLDADLDQILKAAHDMDVEYVLSVCTNLDNFPKILQIARSYKNVFTSLGIHPSEKLDKEPSVDELVKLAEDPDHSSHPRESEDPVTHLKSLDSRVRENDKEHENSDCNSSLVVAIGETGLDYHYDFVSQEAQQIRFRNHIRAAREIKKPLIVHTREARADTLRIMQEEGADKVSGVMHCFTETQETATKALDMGFYISFSGIITFKNADRLREIAKSVPLDRILVETDAPYLAPMPYRGKSNQPAYVRYVAECIAKLRNIFYETIAEHTTQNFFRLFLNISADIKGLQDYKEYGKAKSAK